MYNLQRFSSMLLVLLFHIKVLASLPYQVQPALAQPQPQSPIANAPSLSNNPEGAAAVENRNLDVLDSSASLRSGLEQPVVNLSGDVALSALRALPPPPANPPQVEEVVARSALGLEAPPAPAVATGSSEATSVEKHGAAVVKSLSVQGVGAPVLRSAFESLPSNVSNIEQRALNISSSAARETAPRMANDGQVEARSLNLDAPAERASATGNADLRSFVPSFLNSFGLRKEQDKNSANSPVLDLTVRSGLDQTSPVKNISPVADLTVRSSLGQALLVSNKDAAAAIPQLNANVAASNPDGASMMEVVNLDSAASPAVNVPYINVYPVHNLDF